MTGGRFLEVAKQKIIKCPICQKGKFVDIDHSSGKNSVVCSVCRQFIVLNWDEMTATTGEKIKQVANY